MTPDFRSNTASFSWAERMAIREAARHLHQLGSRAVYEFLLATLLESSVGERLQILIRLREYQKLDAETLAALGADNLPPIPALRSVDP